MSKIIEVMNIVKDNKGVITSKHLDNLGIHKKFLS